MYMYEIVTCLNVWRASCYCFGGSHQYLSLVMRKPPFCKCENKDADQLISAFVFAIRTVPSLFYLNPKFQASSYLLWLYSPVGNPEDRFSQNEAHLAADKFQTVETPVIIFFFQITLRKHVHVLNTKFFTAVKKKKIFR